VPPGSPSPSALDLSRELFGRRFQNPLLLAAGTAGFGRELDGVLDLDRIGGLVTKAVSLQPRQGNSPPRVAEFPGGMLNSVGLANPGIDQVRQEYLPWLAGRLNRARILVNVVGFTVQEYAEVVSRLDGLTGITAFELNLSCPNTAAGGMRPQYRCRVPRPHSVPADREAIAGTAGYCRHGPAGPRCRRRRHQRD
jgi:dihydroorotate dehydrogenase (NAD+) catalytic subunit